MLVASTATTNTIPLTGDDYAASIAPSPEGRTILMLAPFQAQAIPVRQRSKDEAERRGTD